MSPARDIQSKCFVREFLFNLTSLLSIYHIFSFCVSRKFLSVQTCMSLHLCVFLRIFLWHFFSLLCALSYSDLYVLMLFDCYFLHACLFSKEKWCGFGWERRWEESQRKRGRRSCTQNILCKQNLFSIKGEKLKKKRFIFQDLDKSSGSV